MPSNQQPQRNKWVLEYEIGSQDGEPTGRWDTSSNGCTTDNYGRYPDPHTCQVQLLAREPRDMQRLRYRVRHYETGETVQLNLWLGGAYVPAQLTVFGTLPFPAPNPNPNESESAFMPLPPTSTESSPAPAPALAPEALATVSIRRDKPSNALIMELNAKPLHDLLDSIGVGHTGDMYNDRPQAGFRIASGDELSTELFLKRQYPVKVNLSTVFSNPVSYNRLKNIAESSFPVIRKILEHYQPVDIKIQINKRLVG